MDVEKFKSATTSMALAINKALMNIDKEDNNHQINQLRLQNLEKQAAEHKQLAQEIINHLKHQKNSKGGKHGPLASKKIQNTLSSPLTSTPRPLDIIDLTTSQSQSPVQIHLPGSILKKTKTHTVDKRGTKNQKIPSHIHPYTDVCTLTNPESNSRIKSPFPYTSEHPTTPKLSATPQWPIPNLSIQPITNTSQPIHLHARKTKSNILPKFETKTSRRLQQRRKKRLIKKKIKIQINQYNNTLNSGIQKLKNKFGFTTYPNRSTQYNFNTALTTLSTLTNASNTNIQSEKRCLTYRQPLNTMMHNLCTM
jgi:hypothetical protein